MAKPPKGKDAFPKLTRLLQQAINTQSKAQGGVNFNKLTPQQTSIFHGIQQQGDKIPHFQAYNQAPQTISSLLAYLGSMGIGPHHAKQILRPYLRQDVALGEFAPNKYRAPGKMDMLNAVMAGAEQQKAQRQQGRQADILTQYAELQKAMMQQHAQEYQAGEYQKAARIKDPTQQAAALQAIDNYANLMNFTATQDAYSGFSPGGSIAEILARANQGQSAIQDRLYRPSYAGPAATGNDFASQVMGGSGY